MIISRGTTPTFEFKFPMAITNYSTILITFSQNKDVKVDKEKSDLTLVSGTIYSLTFTEDEINLFDEGVFECQVRVVQNDVVAASKIFRARMEDVLNDMTIGG